METIITITGIRPDFIRMSEIFKKLDKNFRHILIHTGQHYDKNLSEVFFKQLEIREPDYILDSGRNSTNHYEQLSYLSKEVPKLIKENNLNPDLILFLGDSNTVGLAYPLKKEGYKIGHIEAGMRSFDRRMLEEINRTVCDHCSDILFVYHNQYKEYLKNENIIENVYVVGNTVVEPFNRYKNIVIKCQKKKELILMDIHRPENFNSRERLEWIINYGNKCSKKYNLPVKILYFKRLKDKLEEFKIELGEIEMIELLPYYEYLEKVYHSKFLISDSGTGQEEPALLETPVVVPRDYTERPMSFVSNCSFKLEETNWEESFKYIEEIEVGIKKIDSEWLKCRDGETSELVIRGIKEYLSSNKMS